MKLLIVLFLAVLMIGGCPSSEEDNGDSNTSNISSLQKKIKKIDEVAWYIKFDKGSENSQWESTIRIDKGGLSSKTFMFTDDTFEGMVHKTWVKCKE